MNFQIKLSVFDRTYLREMERFDYDSLLPLIFELFQKHKFEDKAAELFMYQLLNDSGYSSLEQIPLMELQIIADYFLQHQADYVVDYDEEKLSYLLMAAIKRKDILVYINQAVTDDLLAPISLRRNSVIAFIKKEKIDRITFQTI